MIKREKGTAFDANAALDRLVAARGLKSGWGRDAALGRELGISSKRISGWRERNTLDHLLIALKCHEWQLSISWVFFGAGSRGIVPPVPPPALQPPDPLLIARVVADMVNTYIDRAENEELESAALAHGPSHQFSPL
jgi:hypothetical protein